MDPRTLSISWSHPEIHLQNGIIRIYRIIVTDVESDYVLEISVNDTSTVLSQLSPFHTYEIKIAAYTIDIGPYSNLVSIQMPESGESQSVYIVYIYFKIYFIAI